MTFMRDHTLNAAEISASQTPNFFRQGLAVDGLTMSVCVQCSILIAISQDMAAIASAELKHDQRRHQS